MPSGAPHYRRVSPRHPNNRPKPAGLALLTPEQPCGDSYCENYTDSSGRPFDGGQDPHRLSGNDAQSPAVLPPRWLRFAQSKRLWKTRDSRGCPIPNDHDPAFMDPRILIALGDAGHADEGAAMGFIEREAVTGSRQAIGASRHTNVPIDTPPRQPPAKKHSQGCINHVSGPPGFDDPKVQTTVLGRLTLSTNRFGQRSGRARRDRSARRSGPTAGCR